MVRAFAASTADLVIIASNSQKTAKFHQVLELTSSSSNDRAKNDQDPELVRQLQISAKFDQVLELTI
jgi:hypothetical protein